MYLIAIYLKLCIVAHATWRKDTMTYECAAMTLYWLFKCFLKREVL